MAKRLIYLSVLFALATVAALGGWRAISNTGKVVGGQVARPAIVSSVDRSFHTPATSDYRPHGGTGAALSIPLTGVRGAASGAKAGAYPLLLPR